MTGFERIVRASARRPVRVLVVVAVLAIAGCALALRMEPSAAIDTLVGRGADSFQATERYRERFGDHSVIVLARGELPNLVLTSNLGRLIGLEGCLSGNKPEGEEAPGGAGSPCDRLAQTKPVQVVYGPGTFINAAAGEIRDQIQVQTRTKAAEAERAAAAARRVARSQGRPPAEQRRLARSARRLVYAGFVRDLLQLNLRYGLGLTGLPSVDDPEFVSALVFDPSRGATTPKARFAYLFPSEESALIQVRLKPGLPDEARERGRRARARGGADAAVEAGGGGGLHGDRRAGGGRGPDRRAGRLDAAAADRRARADGDRAARWCSAAGSGWCRSRSRSPRWRSRSAPARCSALPLTMASIAVLPVLLGLGGRLRDPVPGAGERGGSAARAARVAVPVIATAALATGVGFLVLLLSPVPMVRGFGALLVAGIAIAFVVALTAGTAALTLGARPRDGALARSLRGAGELVEAAAERGGAAAARAGSAGSASAAVGGALRRPGRVLAVALAVAAVGWAVDSRTEVVSDVERLVPQDLQAVQDLEALQRATGVAGEIDVVVEGRDLTDPAVVKWMRDYQAGVLEALRVLVRARLRRGRAVPGAVAARPVPLVRVGERPRAHPRAARRGAAVLLAAVITADRRTANLAFGIRLALARAPARDHRGPARAARPAAGRDRPPRRPAGARRRGERDAVGSAAPARDARGRPARRCWCSCSCSCAAPRSAHVGSWRRAWDRAWVPVVPIALATGWSALVLWLLGVPLNPLSAMLGALVLAISTEFAVLLSARFDAERAAGHARGRGDPANLPLDRRGGARLGRDGDRRLRRARAVRRADAARLRPRHGGRPHGLAARRAGGAAGRARARRAPGRGAPRA